MGISLTEHQLTIAEVAGITGDLMAQPVRDIAAISQGANSRVYRFNTPGGEYVVKFYFQHPHDLRDRMGTEFKSLSFLWEQGVRQIPRPLKASVTKSCAVYTLLKGISPALEVNDADIDQAIVFLKELKGLNASALTKGFSPASEAFFCGRDIVNNLKARLKRFSFENKSEEYRALEEYLEEDFIPLLLSVETWSKEYLRRHGVSWDRELDQSCRTLSPSDFGFHNALRGLDGKLFFLDFEYFGWDDPVKTVSDFCWHPAMRVGEALKNKFTFQMQEIFGKDDCFKIRLKAFSPLFGLKWCLIFLNEFVAADMQRRNFARNEAGDQSVVRIKQLARARALSQQIGRQYKDYPYGK